MYYVNDGFYGIEPLSVYNVPDRFCDRQSFYGKAKIVECADGIYLQSYDTLVCFKSHCGTFTKMWSGYSHTTQRHINAFMYHYCGIRCGGKAWWNALEVNKEYRLEDL